uniref:Large ribosomal subunit protein bL17m n=1 Tax=Trichuris muris TaxID=70415 RepID=A0A5S6QPJ5_TRIMR
MSRKFNYGAVKTTLERHARVFPKLLPSIDAFVIPTKAKLKHPEVKNGEGHFIRIRRTVTALFRDERIELPRYDATISRPYAERLIQMAIAYGDRHKPTMEVCDYFLSEKELIHKLFKVYVQRYRDCKSSFTAIYRLPDVYSAPKYRYKQIFILELRGNPYPPVVDKEERHDKSLLNVLLRAYSKRRETKAGAAVSLEDGKAKNVIINDTDTTPVFL